MHINLFLKLDSILFMKIILYIEIFIVETYYLLKEIIQLIDGKLEISDYHNLHIILHQTMKYME